MKKTCFLIAALAIQCIAIGWLIFRYERLVTKGIEVRFKCQAYDPYDPFRGRYLQVSVRESTTNISEEIRSFEDKSFNGSYRNSIFVRIEPTTNGFWQVAEASFTPSDVGVWIKPKSIYMEYILPWSAKEKDEKWNDFKKRQQASGIKIIATLPDRLFVNENIAPASEKILQDASRHKKESAVAIYRVLDGEIVITDIEINGKSITSMVRESHL